MKTPTYNTFLIILFLIFSSKGKYDGTEATRKSRAGVTGGHRSTLNALPAFNLQWQPAIAIFQLCPSSELKHVHPRNNSCAVITLARSAKKPNKTGPPGPQAGIPPGLRPWEQAEPSGWPQLAFWLADLEGPWGQVSLGALLLETGRSF